MLDKIVETDNLTKIYGAGKIPVTAISGISLSINRGSFFGITGTSGSGKSTILNLLGGLDTPTSGTINVEGRNISLMNREELARYRREEVGMVFQSFNLISSYTASENVGLPLLFSGVAKKERNRRAADLLQTVGLEHRISHRPSELSGGEQQRVSIARALINRPRILLADEPTGNLDSKTSREIVEVLSKLNAEQGVTVIMVTHEEGFLKEFASEVIRLEDGRITSEVRIR